MNFIFLLLKKRRDFFVFCLLFLLSLGFVFSSNLFPKSRYLHFANSVSGNVYSVVNQVTNYFNLNKQNQFLWDENNLLRQEIFKLHQKNKKSSDTLTTLNFGTGNFKVVKAQVIKNNFHFSKNYILIDRGSKDSVGQDMGVVSSQGIVGIIDKNTNGFSAVQSVLNVKSKISASLKKSGHYGTLQWNSKQINRVQLTDIQSVVQVSVGDTIITDGRSSIFPKGIPIGKIVDFKENLSDRTKLIEVELFTDMRNVQYVYILKNQNQSEIKSLENQLPNE